MDYRGLSYNKLSALFIRRELDPYELMEQYKKARKTAMRQINRIEKSAIPFSGAEKPKFPAPSAISSTNELLHAMAELSAFTGSKAYSLSGRVETRDKAISTLHEHGITFVTVENYPQYARFMKWFYDNNLNKIYGSQEDVVEDFFMEQWSRVINNKTDAARKAAFTRFVNRYLE